MTSTGLKLIALALMLIDHMYEYIGGMPIWLTWLGRLSAPVFIFCMVWGFHYTHNRKKYLWNMYWWSIGMAVGDTLMAILAPNPERYLYNNFFTTLLLINIIVLIIEYFRDGEKKRAVIMLGLLALVQIVGYGVGRLGMNLLPQYDTFLIAKAVFPNVYFCEGGLEYVIFGVALYFTKQSKLKLSLVCVAFSLYWVFLSPSFTYENLFLQNYKWLLIGALPLMLCYNGKKGRGLKWLFYAFYPIHIYLIYWIGTLLK